MKITQAITEARALVRLARHGKQWVVIGPFDEPYGPSMHSDPTDYWRARAAAREWRASVASRLVAVFN